MRITRKKQIRQTEQQIIRQLTKVCHCALQDINGFVWLTHLVDYNQLESSLTIICIFATETSQIQARLTGQDVMLKTRINDALKVINIRLKNPSLQIQFDNEEACLQHHNGNWQLRLTQRH